MSINPLPPEPPILSKPLNLLEGYEKLEDSLLYQRLYAAHDPTALLALVTSVAPAAEAPELKDTVGDEGGIREFMGHFHPCHP